MSVQEVMNLVKQDTRLTNYGIAIFLLIPLFIGIAIHIDTSIDRHINRKLWRRVERVFFVLIILSVYGFAKLADVQYEVDSKIGKAVIEKRITKYTHWEQSENGDYYFGKYRVDENNVSITKHHPRLSKSYAEVKTTYISNRFTKKQKAKVYKALNSGDARSLGNKATINK